VQKLNFTIDIQASKEKVWQTLWNDETYRQWTTAFCDGSYAVTDWKEGSKVHFLDPNGQGMYSLIEKVIGNEFISFKHLGALKDKIEQPIDEAAKQWSGCYENYSLTESDGITTLSVEVDSVEQYLDFFNEKFPAALQNVKELSETKTTAAF
jgi:hypothetical protein